MSCLLRFQSAQVICHGLSRQKEHGLIKRYSLGTAFALMTLLFAVSVARGDDGLAKTLPIGASAPDFTLPGIDGRNHSLQDYADARILVIIFTANHCKTAQAYEGRIIQLVNDYKDKGVAVVGIAPNDPQALSLSELVYSDLSDSFAELQIRAQERGFNFPYLYDGDSQKVSRAYGPVSTPHVFIFDQARKLRYVGRIDDSENIAAVTRQDARNALDALLAGKPVPVEKTRTFGCSIKWSEKRAAAARELEAMEKEPVALQSADVQLIKTLVTNNTPKMLLINVWATWCGPCLAELPELVTMNRMYRNGNFELVTINADTPDRKALALADLQERHVAARNYIFDNKDKDALADALDAEWPGGLPYTILVAPGGKILQRQMGRVDSMKLKKVIALYPTR
ncbi:MAG TPA: redoxin domain-containing protein [Candidatus Saccharimonadales bacterium]|nr:redoxin domain-containing protein [Candidatus Saccharimonadales bacterium]